MSATDSFTVTVREVNRAPQLTVPGSQVIDELTTLNVAASATDGDTPANGLSYALTASPAGMTIDPASGAITWEPSEAQGPSEHTVTVVVTDDNPDAINPRQMSATDSFTATVREVNITPELEAIGDESLHYGFALSLQAVASDVDLPGNTLVFTLDESPAGMLIGSSSGQITWTPVQAQVGDHSVTVRVTDAGTPPLSATRTFSVMVTGEGSSLGIGRLTGSDLKQISLIGDIGLTYELQYSTDLLAWERLLQFTLDTSPYPYVDPVSPPEGRRFYRLLLVE